MEIKYATREVKNTEVKKHSRRMKLIYGKPRFTGDIKNINDFGIEFQCNAKIPCFHKVEMFMCLGGRESIMCTGIVVVSEKDLNNPRYCTVIVFDKLSASNRQKISGYFKTPCKYSEG